MHTGQTKRKPNLNSADQLHRKYGVWSNTRYIWQKMLQYDRRFLLLVPLGMIVTPVMKYLWTFLTKQILDVITGEQDSRQLFFVLLIFTGIQIVAGLLATYFNTESWWRPIIARNFMLGEKNEKIMTIAYEYLEDSDLLDCYQKAKNACNSNDDGVEAMMRGLMDFVVSLSVVIVGLFILGTMNGFVVLWMVVLALLYFAYSTYISKKNKEEFDDMLAPWWRKRDYMQHITTDFEAAKDIRMFYLRDLLVNKYKSVNAVFYAAQKAKEKRWCVVLCTGSLMWALSQAAVYAWLILSLIQGELTIGNFSLYVASTGTFFEYINHLFDQLGYLLTKSREVDDFRTFLDFEGKEDCGRAVPPMNSYTFTFENVSFRYPKTEKYALKNLSITLQAGERLAVVGLNGAGKTTFIKLLLRLYEPTEGRILLNGVDIREYNRKSYYTIFSPAFQDVELFAFPLAENVSMKTPLQTDREKAGKCLEAAGLSKKLASLPKGLSTEMLKMIYDDGVDFSGGERQKLALARALYKDAPVVVLDEPTAALDALAEYQLYQDFDKLIGNKTAVYISHRLSSTQFCNCIAMFRDGEMVEYGTHTELLLKGGAYAEMFAVQAKYYVEEEASENGGRADD